MTDITISIILTFIASQLCFISIDRSSYIVLFLFLFLMLLVSGQAKSMMQIFNDFFSTRSMSGLFIVNLPVCSNWHIPIQQDVVVYKDPFSFIAVVWRWIIFKLQISVVCQATTSWNNLYYSFIGGMAISATVIYSLLQDVFSKFVMGINPSWVAIINSSVSGYR